eukprot:12105333-Karenia_brevis.AAC.1
MPKTPRAPKTPRLPNKKSHARLCATNAKPQPMLVCPGFVVKALFVMVCPGFVVEASFVMGCPGFVVEAFLL